MHFGTAQVTVELCQPDLRMKADIYLPSVGKCVQRARYLTSRGNLWNPIPGWQSWVISSPQGRGPALSHSLSVLLVL